MSAEEHESAWRKLHWPVDEIFMAWQYAKFVNRVVEEGKAEYNIPMSSTHGCSNPTWRGREPIRAADRCRR